MSCVRKEGDVGVVVLEDVDDVGEDDCPWLGRRDEDEIMAVYERDLTGEGARGGGSEVGQGWGRPVSSTFHRSLLPARTVSGTDTTRPTQQY